MMQKLLLAFTANTLEQLILNHQSVSEIVESDQIQYRLQLDNTWPALNTHLQNHEVLKEVLQPIHPLSTQPSQDVILSYNTAVRVAQVYEVLNALQVNEFIQEKHIHALHKNNIVVDQSVDDVLASLRLALNQLQTFYYQAAEHNLVVVAVQGDHLVGSYF